jgi:hypothetical protein
VPKFVFSATLWLARFSHLPTLLLVTTMMLVVVVAVVVAAVPRDAAVDMAVVETSQLVRFVSSMGMMLFTAASASITHSNLKTCVNALVMSRTLGHTTSTPTSTSIATPMIISPVTWIA